MNDNKLQVHNTSVTPYMATATKPADKVSAPSLQPGRASADGRQLVFKGWEAARMGLQPGDHVKFRCGVYFHHGIYVGDGRFIHKVSGGGSLATASFSKHASVIGVGAFPLPSPPPPSPPLFTSD